MKIIAVKLVNHFKSILGLSTLLIVAFFLQACAQTSQDENAIITIGVSEQAIEQMNQSVSTRAVTGKPEAINSIIISVASANSDPIGSGDILQSGGSITFAVPPHTELVIDGKGYAGTSLLFQGQTNLAALRPGEQSNASFTLNDVSETTGEIAGTVRDAVALDGNGALEGVQITATSDDGNIVITELTDVTGQYTLTLPANLTYIVTFDLASYLSATYANVLVSPGQTNILETVLQINDANSGTGSVSGQVVSALTGAAVEGVNLVFREGINVTTGPTLAQVTTDATGNYNITDVLTAGNYTCELSLSGYVTDYISILVIGGQVTIDQNAALSPILNTGETRIILTWGNTPSDLDSHLTGPETDNSTTRFHIYYDSNVFPLPAAASNPEPIVVATVPGSIVSLDRDDTSSFGPETITISAQSQGIFRYSIHDFTNKASTISSALSLSSAQVKVVREGKPDRIFNVPNAEGTLWTVFELDNDTITPVNTMSYEADAAVIKSLTPKNDAYLLTNLPIKQ